MRRRAEAREKPEKRGDEGEWRKKVEEGRLDHWNRWRGLREGGGGVCSEREREKGGGEEGGWTQRGSIQRCWTKVHSHLSEEGEKTRIRGAGVKGVREMKRAGCGGHE